MNLNITVVLFNLFILLILLILYWKIRKIHLKQYEIEDKLEKVSDNSFSQVEALTGIYLDLSFKKSLPKTREWAGSPDFLWYIARLAEQNAPLVIVECSSGISTVILAQCLMKNGRGHVYSLDHDPVFAEKTREELKRHGLSQWASVLDAPLIKHNINEKEWLWYSFDELKGICSIDMIVVDGPPTHIGKYARYPAGPLLFKLLSNNGCIVLDDANRDDEKDIVDFWMKEEKYTTKINAGCEKGCIVLKP